jgi:hypothetical protein
MTSCTTWVLLRAVAWPTVLTLTLCAELVAGVGVALGPASSGSVPLVAAGALLAAAAAFSLDEPSAAIVDIAPTSRARRTLVRACALCVPLGAGMVEVGAVHGRDQQLSTAALTLTAIGNVFLGFAVACAVRRRYSEPGVLAASAITVTLVVAPLLNPIAQRVQLFPGAASATASAGSWWLLIIGLSVLTVAFSVYLRDSTSPVWNIRRRQS